MKLLVVRHAQALDKEEASTKGIADEDRPLTRKGIHLFEGLVRHLASVDLKLDMILSSPWLRAIETADILKKYQPKLKVKKVDELAGDADVKNTLDVIFQDVETLAIVGHEPHLSHFMGLLLTGKNSSFIDLKKGAICCLEISGDKDNFTATMEWLLTPNILS